MAYIDQAIQILTPGALYSIDGDITSQTDWDDPKKVQWIDLQKQPTWTQVFTKICVIRVTEALTNKYSEVSNWKNTQFNSNIAVPVSGTTYNFAKDFYSKISMNFAAQNNQVILSGIDWVTADGVLVHLSSTQMLGLITLISIFDTAIVTRGRRMKIAIAAIPIDMSQLQKTLDAINNFDIQSIA